MNADWKRQSIVIPLATLLLLLIPADAQVPPNQVKLSWQHPTQHADGTPMPLSEIQGYFVQWSLNGSDVWNQFPPLGVTTGFTHANLSPGRYCYRVIVTARDVPSLPSNEFCKVIPASPPKPVVLSGE